MTLPYLSSFFLFENEAKKKKASAFSTGKTKPVLIRIENPACLCDAKISLYHELKVII